MRDYDRALRLAPTRAWRGPTTIVKAIESGRTLKILNAKAGTALDLSKNDGHTIAGWHFHGVKNQIWELHQVEGGSWLFRSVASGKYLAPGQGPDRDGRSFVGSDQSFAWHIWPDEQDQSVHRICQPNTVFNIDLTGHGNVAGGIPIQLWGRWEGRNQC